MKPQTLLIGLLLGTAAFAQKQTTEAPVTTTVHLTEATRTLYVESDVTVILTGNETSDVVIEGDARDLKTLRAKAADGTLSLFVPLESSAARLKVYVPASQLSKVYLFGKSVLRSETVLQNPKIKIILAGESVVNVSSVGKVLIEGSDDFDFIKSR